MKDHTHSSWRQIKAMRDVADTIEDARLDRAFALGERFVEERKQRGWSQAELARRAGLPLDVVDAAELGDPDVPANALGSICHALGLASAPELRA